MFLILNILINAASVHRGLIDGTVVPNPLDRSNWRAEANTHSYNGVPQCSVDSTRNCRWHTAFDSTGKPLAANEQPYIYVDMKAVNKFQSFSQ